MYPAKGLVPNTVLHFKLHVAMDYGVNLRL